MSYNEIEIRIAKHPRKLRTCIWCGELITINAVRRAYYYEGEFCYDFMHEECYYAMTHNNLTYDLQVDGFDPHSFMRGTDISRHEFAFNVSGIESKSPAMVLKEILVAQGIPIDEKAFEKINNDEELVELAVDDCYEAMLYLCESNAFQLTMKDNLITIAKRNKNEY